MYQKVEDSENYIADMGEVFYSFMLEFPVFLVVIRSCSGGLPNKSFCVNDLTSLGINDSGDRDIESKLSRKSYFIIFRQGEIVFELKT